MPESPAPPVPFVLPESPVEADLLAKYFRGLGDPTRVRILQLLAEHGELAVAELVTRLGQSQSKVSNHLACLRWCGFVATRRAHPSVYYRVADERVIELLGLARGLLADNPEHVAACGQIDSTPSS
jgi:DNA-binding transcriptional ArsR family regulator